MDKKITFELVNCGDILPEVRQLVDQEVIWQHAAGSMDYNPVHNNPEWCKTAQVFGLPVTVMHGNQTMSLMCKVVTNWAYPSGGRMKRIEAKLVRPVPVNMTCIYGATVTEKHPIGAGKNFVTLDIWARDEQGNTVGVAGADVYLP